MGGGAVYRDNTYQPVTSGRPNPRVLSNTIFASESRATNDASQRNLTALAVFVGMHAFMEVANGLRAGCPAEHLHIPVPKCDAQFDPECSGRAVIPFSRTRYAVQSGQGPSVPRSQLTESTAWIDGSSVYGNGKTWSDLLRAAKGGKMKARDEQGLLPAVRNTAQSHD